jgi:hypothetical protein
MKRAKERIENSKCVCGKRGQKEEGQKEKGQKEKGGKEKRGEGERGGIRCC